MNIKFLEPHMYVDHKDETHSGIFFGKCKEYSNIVTDSQKLQITPTHSAALSLIISHVEGLSQSSASIVVDNWQPLTVKNFFGMFDGTPPQLLKNLQFVLDAFHQVLSLEVNTSQRTLLLQAQRTESPGEEYWENCKTKTEKKFLSCAYQAPREKSGSGGRFDHCSRSFSWIVEAVHCCSLDIEKLRVLPRLFKLPEPQVTQRSEPSRYDYIKAIVTSIEYLEANIFNPCRELTKLVESKIKTEQYLIMEMRKQSGKDIANGTFKKYIVQRGDDWDYNFAMWGIALEQCERLMRVWHSGFTIESKDLSLHPSNIRDRFAYLGKCVVFLDIVDTYLKVGCDPALPDPPAEGIDNLAPLRTYLE